MDPQKNCDLGGYSEKTNLHCAMKFAEISFKTFDCCFFRLIIFFVLSVILALNFDLLFSKRTPVNLEVV
jgi:hypothetical protein